MTRHRGCTYQGGAMTLGILEWFEVNEHERVERVLSDLRAMGIEHLRTGVSWADWHTEDGPEWYRWLLPRLAREVEVLPCFLYTPPSMGLTPTTASPPREVKLYADFVDVMITRCGKHFEWVELWNEPNNLSEWDWTLDPGWKRFAKMVINAGHWAQHRGKRTILGGPSPIDTGWFAAMCERGVMEHVDAVGIHGFPGTWEGSWCGWPRHVECVQQTLTQHGYERPIWITETGYSTLGGDEHTQLAHFKEAIAAPVPRVYWYCMDDLDPARSTVDGFHVDEREYHFGLKTSDGRAKALFRHLIKRARNGNGCRQLTTTHT